MTDDVTNPVKVTCHCGAVELRVTLSDGLATARRCDCSFCRRRGTPAVSAPLDGLEILRGADKLTLYQWGTKTAKHYFCSVCGIYTHHRRRSDPNEYGVNMGGIEGVNPALHEPIGWHDGVNHPSDR
ncbi:GFA family protein [Roseovarius sp. SCSIO 43702]|uniref:GFA family protein n=1 Tax=Roseovarius sp. SCSIO 43702 TaxID=2823043 RepID=UPI00217572F5|nr:GFA family protein [Roseovarius sp. SCSIO 43702]